MITLIDNALELDPDCKMVSCHFDQTEFERESLPAIQARWKIVVPDKMHNAVDKRKAEFIAGRYCANKAIQLLVAPSSTSDFIDIEVGEKRQPLWPQGLTGSITHSHGFAAAVAANINNIRSIGIDSEQVVNPKTANDVATHILTSAETYADNDAIVANSRLYLTLIFSAKESIFKCLNPLVLQYFDFQDAIVSLATNTPGQFSFVLQKTLTDEFCEGYTGCGRFYVSNDFVHTAVILRP